MLKLLVFYHNALTIYKRVFKIWFRFGMGSLRGADRPLRPRKDSALFKAKVSHTLFHYLTFIEEVTITATSLSLF